MARASEEEVTWSGKHALVTGGAGFIGSHVVDALVARGARVTIYDNFSTGFREFVPPREHLRVVEADLLDQSALDRAMRGVDFVFHLAANADIKDNLREPRKCVEQNVVATQNVLEAMRSSGVREIAFSSTGSVYGDATVIPTPEDAPCPVQTSIYATSKIAAEGLLTSYVQPVIELSGGAPAPPGVRRLIDRVWIFRFVSLLGPRYTHGHVIDFFRKLKADPTRLPVLGDGRQKKSYLHVGDCVAAMFVAIERSREPINVYNLGHDDWIDVSQSVACIAKAMGVTPRIEYAGGDRGWPGDSPRILLDTRRLRALGWAPTKSIEESIVETLRFLAENPYALKR
jgi:UDP-glucose 4-epimerase